VKVEALLLSKNIEPEFSLAEEVLFNLTDSPRAQRWLMATAIVMMAQCLRTGLGFQVRTLEQDVLGSFDPVKNTLTCAPAILAAIQQIEPILSTIFEESKKELLAEYRRQLTIAVESALSAERAAVAAAAAAAGAGTGAA
jgi:hypothetical protein